MALNAGREICSVAVESDGRIKAGLAGHCRLPLVLRWVPIGRPKGNSSSEEVLAGGTGWCRQADHATAVPLGPPLGTTLAVYFPFEYHRYPQYHPGYDWVG